MQQAHKQTCRASKRGQCLFMSFLSVIRNSFAAIADYDNEAGCVTVITWEEYLFPLRLVTPTDTLLEMSARGLMHSSTATSGYSDILSAVATVASSVRLTRQFPFTLLGNMIIKAAFIIITNLFLFYLPSSNAYWQGWNGNPGLSRPSARLHPLETVQTFKEVMVFVRSRTHLPVDLWQLLLNLCSRMDAIITRVHSREDAVTHWRCQADWVTLLGFIREGPHQPCGWTCGWTLTLQIFLF